MLGLNGARCAGAGVEEKGEMSAGWCGCARLLQVLLARRTTVELRLGWSDA